MKATFHYHQKPRFLRPLTKIQIFLDGKPCQLVNGCRRLEGAYCLHLSVEEADEVFVLMETVRSSETPVNFHQTTWQDIPDGGSFYIYLYLSCTFYKYLCSIVCLM
jgi:hypothetical protein